MFIAKMPSLKDKYLEGLDKEKNKLKRCHLHQSAFTNINGAYTWCLALR